MKNEAVATLLFVPGLIWLIQAPLTAKAPMQQAQAPAAQTAPQTPRLRGGASEGPPQRPIAYPDRPRASEEVLERGKAVYGVSCAFCHGSDAGGGEVGPNLWRSSVVLDDQNGELIAPIVHGSRADKGMPRIDISDAQVTDIAAWLHSIHIASRTESSEGKINVLVGDAKAGEAEFGKTCGSCHSATGDLKGLATRFPEPRVLQQTWLLPGGGGGRGPAGMTGATTPGLHVPPTTVTVTMKNGQKAEGELTRVDDFYVGLKDSNGSLHGFDRVGDTPKVELHDPLAPHRELLRKYTDKQIHDITAYLVTLK